MNSKHIRADLNLAWPTAEIAVMGPMARSTSSSAARSRPKTPSPARSELVADYKRAVRQPLPAAQRGYVDDVIEPSRTRPR
jgi:propionyl-CoA carboxylase beta chain